MVIFNNNTCNFLKELHYTEERNDHTLINSIIINVMSLNILKIDKSDSIIRLTVILIKGKFNI